MANDLMQTIVAKLADRGVHATVEYPGFIAVPANKVATWHFGTANPTWGGELVTWRGTVLDTTDFEVPSSTDDVELIANMIWDLVR